MLVEIEVILNSRPLCPLYDDDLEEPLTPNHLLFGRKLQQCNEQGSEVDMSITPKRVQYIETLVEHFWGRWRREYVTTLRNHQQTYKKRKSLVPEIDDVVLIFEEKVPRQNWCLGRVMEILPSRDNQVRGAKVLVGKSRQILERPINKLYPIEFADEGKSKNHNKTRARIVEVVNNSEAIEKIHTSDVFTRGRREAAILADIKRKSMR